MKRPPLALPCLLLAVCAARTSHARPHRARTPAQPTQTTAPAGTAAPVSAADAEKWREDLRLMAAAAERRHKNLFHTVSRAEFAAAAKRLDERIPRLARHQIIVELARVMALNWPPWDTRRWTAPHVKAEMTSADYRANADPALGAALSYTPRAPLAELLNGALDRGDLALAVKRYRDFRAEPPHLYFNTDPAMIAVGVRLIGQKKFAEAVELLRLNAEANPESGEAHALLGEAHLLGGDRQSAARHFERALALHPQNAYAADRLRQLRQK